MTTRTMTLLLVLGLLHGCSADDDAGATEGSRLYRDNCAPCHKASGKGNFIKGIPANVDTQLNKAQIVTLITQGLPSRPQMPVFDKLSKVQAEAIADHLLQMGRDR